MERHLTRETDILTPTYKQIQKLLINSFPDVKEFTRHSYFRSEPDFRILLAESSRICGHISLSGRSGLVGSRELMIAGVGGLAVEPAYRRRGVALGLDGAGKDIYSSARVKH